MNLSNKMSKLLIVVSVSILFSSVNSSEVIAKAPVKKSRQSQFLEDRRISQSVRMGGKQQNARVKGMLTSKELEELKRLEIEYENELIIEEAMQEMEEMEAYEMTEELEIGPEETEPADSYSQVVNSIRRSQRRRRELDETLHKTGGSVDSGKTKEKKTNNYYKNTNIPIIKNTARKASRIPVSEANLSERVDINLPSSNPLIGQLEVIKDLIEKPVPDSEPVEMNYSDLEMLEKIVMAESGAEPYIGQIAVTNVILNRVKSNRYPSTLKGVIFQRSQFSPVKNGVIRGYAPSASVKKAVAEALNGRMIVPEDTLYFVNPVLATDQTVPRTKTPVKVIGTHTFYK
nr:cell wall hydrolase [Tissierella sp.]